MTIIRKILTTGFTTVPNDMLRDPNLSFRSKGVLAMLLSHADEFSLSSSTAARMGTDGITSVRSAYGELEATGYMLRVNERLSNGHFSKVIYIADAPQREWLQPDVSPRETSGSPTPVSLTSVTPTSVTPSRIEEQERKPREKTKKDQSQNPSPKSENPFAPPLFSEEGEASSPRKQSPSGGGRDGTRGGARSKRKPDPIWDAVAHECGISGAPLTRSEAANMGRTVKELREAAATPEEIRARAQRYKRSSPGARLTHMILRNRWAELSVPLPSPEAHVPDPRKPPKPETGRWDYNERPVDWEPESEFFDLAEEMEYRDAR